MAQFTEGELDVMRILWVNGEMKPAEIQNKFPREIKNSALRSYLTILLEKGHLTRRKVGKAFYYRPKTRRDSAFRNTLRSFLDTFCEGSPEGLLVRLIKAERLSEKELLQLKRLADEGQTLPETERGRDEK